MATTPAPKTPKPQRWAARRLVAIAAVPLVLLLAAIVGLPWLLSSPAGTRWLLGKADQVLAPGAVELGSLRLSWFSPTRMTRVVLRDHQGQPVVTAPSASLDRNLRQLLFERPNLGTLVLDHGVVDAERLPDGTIDLYETLRPVIGKNPRTDLRIVIVDGRVRFQSAGLAEPLDASPASVDLHIAPSPQLLTLRATLRKPASLPGGVESTLTLDGGLDAWAERQGRPARLAFSVVSRDWPLRFEAAGLTGSARLDGTVTVTRAGPPWTLAGDAAIRQLDLTGAPLAGDHLRLDRLAAGWDLTADADRLDVRKLDVNAPILTLRAKGAFPEAGGPGAVVEGTLDLAAVANQLPHRLALQDGVTLERGKADLRITSTSQNGPPTIEVTARVADLVARNGPKSFHLDDPAALSARVVRPEGGAYQVERLALETPYLTATARGDLTAGTTALTARFDLGKLQTGLREIIDLGGVELAGQGELEGDYRAGKDGYRGHVAARLAGLRVANAGPFSLSREQASLRVDLTGPVGPSGWPADWSELTSRAVSGAAAADLAATAADRRATLALRLPVQIGAIRPDAEASLTARWTDAAVEIDSLDVQLKPGKDRPDLSPLRTTARGRFDRAKGELTLRPFWPGTPPGALGLRGDGITLGGLNRGAGVRGTGELAGDLAAIGPWLAPPWRDLKGTWVAVASASSGNGGIELGGQLDLDGLRLAGPSPDVDSAFETLGPIKAIFQAVAAPDAARVDLNEFVVSCRLATLELSGKLDDPRGERRLALDGRILPEWDALSSLLAKRVEPGAVVRGRAAPLRLRVALTERWRETLEGSAGVALEGADLFGLKVGPTALVVRSKAGVPSIDPIDLAVNQGQVHLEPALRLDDPKGRAIEFGPGSSINDVVINEEVSHRVLSFATPVFDRATRVRGRVSAEIDAARVPLDGPGPAGLTLDGALIFQEVQFLPGPFADPLMDLIGRKDRPLMTLDQTVALAIADRRVYQNGLALPIGRLTRIGLDGWVDFDRNLNLVASVPILPTALADKPVIGEIANTAIIRVPVRGTLRDPKVDRETFKLGMKEMGQSVLERSLTRAVPGLLDLITRPRDPNAPPPPPPLTREQRRAQQLERRAERRRQRGLEP